MGKHKSDKVSKTMQGKSNKAGPAPQAPNMDSNDKNMYR